MSTPINELGPGTRQRFVALEFDFLPSGVESALATSLVGLGQRLRAAGSWSEAGTEYAPGRQWPAATCRLLRSFGRPVVRRPALIEAMGDLLDATFP